MISDAAVERLRTAAALPDCGDRYDVRGVAGHGGMGTVFVVHDSVLGRDVAIKVVDVVDARGERVERLRREARILARLDHPAIVPVHDVGTLPDGRTFYVMKLIKGQRLDAIADRPLPVRLDVFARILDAVGFAHAQGVVHRDLKPENVMTGAFGEVYVMDWGVALDGGSTVDRAVVGTPGFMPPEQERGQDVDLRADIYALGAILAWLAGPDAPAVQAIAHRAMRANPADRYQSVEALADEVSRFRQGLRVMAYEEPISERVVRIYRRYELPIVLLVAYVLVRFALILWKGV